MYNRQTENKHCVGPPWRDFVSAVSSSRPLLRASGEHAQNSGFVNLDIVITFARNKQEQKCDYFGKPFSFGRTSLMF